MSRANLLADLIVALPDVHSMNADGEESIVLLDTRGQILHQWGTYDPEQAEGPRVVRAFDAPLASWSLAYYLSGAGLDAGLGRGTRVALGSGLGAMALVLIGVAVYLYRETRRDMREASQRVDFVNQVSHELRTPLTNIRMYAELLEREVDQDNPRALRHLGVIVNESQRLSRLIGNVLSFSAEQRQSLRLHRDPGVIDDVVSDVISQFSPSLSQKGIEVEFHGDARDTVSLDSDVVGQILANLVSNVEKYAAASGTLVIETARHGAVSEIAVQDRGPGIPPKQAERIFEAFYRLSDRVDEGVAGSGIGLTLSRRLARLHGGDLVLTPADHGARFVLNLHTPRDDDGIES
jgi:signal transduction histidine kinase